MKKLVNNLLLVAALVGMMVLPALAQDDLFNGSRTLVLSAPQKLAMTGTTAALATNVVDLRGFLGRGFISLNVISNSADVAVDPTLIVTLEAGTDTTNYTTLSSALATATQTSVIITNSSLGTGTNISVTDTFLLPGTLTTPTAATAGFATPYVSPAAFTGSGLFTNNSASKSYLYGINLQDTARYLRVRYSLNGSNANYGVSATLTGLGAKP
jgi:hypothetical protein